MKQTFVGVLKNSKGGDFLHWWPEIGLDINKQHQQSQWQKTCKQRCFKCSIC